MRFSYDPESKIQERVGQVAVTVLLVAVFLITAGCQDSNGDEIPATTTQAESDHGTTAVRTVQPQPEPVRQPVEPTPLTPRVVSFEEAESAFRDKRYGESVELFTSYTSDKPDNPWGHYMLGLAAWKNGELDRAEQSLRRTLELDQNHVKSYVNLGRVLLEQGRPEEARDAALEAVDIDPVSTDGYRVLGLAYDENGETDSAVTAYREALKLDGNDAWSMNNLGLLFIREGRFEDALGPLTRAVELRDDVATFHNNLGMALERTGYVADAADEYELAVAAAPDHTRATTNLERVRELGDADKRVNRVELAQAFAQEIQRWRDEEVAAVDLPETGGTGSPEPVESDEDTGQIELGTETLVPTVDSTTTRTSVTDSVTTGPMG
jgi:Flp pilus assembly protein TadD